MRNRSTLRGGVVLLALMILVSGSVSVFGQGGTGKLPPIIRRPPPPRTNPPIMLPPSCSAKSPKQATGRTHTVDLGGGVKLEMVEIPAGSFCMGSNNGEKNEKPVHQVTISRSLYIGKTEVTQAQWQAVMGTSIRQQRDKIATSFPLAGEGNDYPMYYVNWDEAQEFIRRLNQTNHDYTYRLPTEAEWEYACRAGTTGDYAGDLSSMAWYGNSGDQAHPVGTKRPNSFGLYDMHGNVYEWVQDWYGENYSGSSSRTDPQGPRSGKYKVLRGGVWGFKAQSARSASRMPLEPGELDAYYGHGFRIVAVARAQRARR